MKLHLNLYCVYKFKKKKKKMACLNYNNKTKNSINVINLKRCSWQLAIFGFSRFELGEMVYTFMCTARSNLTTYIYIFRNERKM